MVFIFCPFCLVQLSDLKKGVPHAPTTLPRYVSQDPQQSVSKTFTERTVEGMAAKAEAYAKSGLPRSQISKFENCERKPLIDAKGPVLDHVSVMPLHLSLGIGLQLVDMAEDLATAINLEIREDNGLSSAAVITAIEKNESLQQEHKEMEDNLNSLKANAEHILQQLLNLNQQHPEFEAKTGTIFTNRSKEAVEGRKKIRELKQQQVKNKQEQKIM